MKTKRHRYRPAEEHICSLAIIIGTITLLYFCHKWSISDITGIVFFPLMFCGIIFRCAWDWIHAFFAVAMYASKHILTKRGEN